MLADIRALADDIGIRFVGSPADAQAAKYLAGRFRDTGLEPMLVPFPVLGWSLKEEARLEIQAGAERWRVPCYPFVYSSSSPVAGFSGKLVYAGKQELFASAKYRAFERGKFRFRKYSILDRNGMPAAQVVSRDFPDGALTAAWGMLPLPRTTPTVLVSEKDGRRLEALVAAGASATLHLSTEFHPDWLATNVFAHLPGSDSRRADEQILVAAHFDTQYTGPGAVDNASGVAAVLSLARHLKAKQPRRSILFAIYSGEEVGFVGARHHLAGLKETERLSSIRAVVNLDMLACNEPNWIHASEDFLAQESSRRAAADLGIAEKYGSLEIVTPPWPSGDQDPFYDENIPCVSFTWKGYKYPYTHTPQDTSDKVDAEVLLDSFHLACRVIEHMDQMM